MAVPEGGARDAFIKLSRRSAVTVVLASGGYPGEYRKGFSITGRERIDGAQPSDLKVQWALQKIRVKVFHSGTGLSAGQLVTDGGRVLAVTAMADDLKKAVYTAYQATDMIQFEDKHYRREVAHRELKKKPRGIPKWLLVGFQHPA
jgi:phosphoribosylamine-glycine ligase